MMAAAHAGLPLPPMPLRPLQVWVLLACLALAPVCTAQAQTAPAAAPASATHPLNLQPSPWLEENLPPTSQQTPSFIFGDKLDGEIDRHVTSTGHAEVRKPGNVLKGDVIRHDQTSNTLTAQGNVRLNQMGNVFRGDRLQLQLDSYEGYFNNIDFEMLQNGGVFFIQLARHFCRNNRIFAQRQNSLTRRRAADA